MDDWTDIVLLCIIDDNYLDYGTSIVEGKEVTLPSLQVLSDNYTGYSSFISLDQSNKI